MIKQYLLTFMIYGEKDFRWFDTEEELRDFITKRKEDIDVFDVIRIDKGEKLSTRELF